MNTRDKERSKDVNRLYITSASPVAPATFMTTPRVSPPVQVGCVDGKIKVISVLDSFDRPMIFPVG
jgi:hypothetical protein